MYVFILRLVCERTSYNYYVCVRLTIFMCAYVLRLQCVGISDDRYVWVHLMIVLCEYVLRLLYIIYILRTSYNYYM